MRRLNQIGTLSINNETDDDDASQRGRLGQGFRFRRGKRSLRKKKKMGK